MQYDAINLSQSDLPMGISFLLETTKDLKLPILSSNLVEGSNGKPVFDSFMINKRYGLRIGIFGVMDQTTPSQKIKGYIIKDPFDTSRDIINTFKSKADLIIALSSLPQEKNAKLLEVFPDIDFVISAHLPQTKLLKMKHGYILSSGSKGKYLGRLDIRLNSLDRPLGLEDIGKRTKLEKNLSWLEKRISKLEEAQNDILKSDKTDMKERFKKELKRFKSQKRQVRKELACLDNVRNHFENKVIPLAAKSSEMVSEDLSFSSKKTGLQEKGASPQLSSGPHIKITELPISNEQMITFVLHIDKAPNQVRAMGFDIQYQPEVLKYSGYKKGSLVEKFDMFETIKIKDGLLRIGGFEARDDMIKTGMSDELLRLNFKVIGKGSLDIMLVRLKDDISAWSVLKASEKNE